MTIYRFISINPAIMTKFLKKDALNIKWFEIDNRFLRAIPPTHEPRATNFISEMISMIEKLINQGNAYVVSDGQVLFSVKSFQIMDLYLTKV